VRLLSFDTSTSDLHACLFDSGQVKAKETINSNLNDRQYAAARLLPAIQGLLDEADWQKTDLEAIVVGIGPGSFTGVRTAVVTARTIAQALNLPLIGISILECYVYRGGKTAAVVLDAGSARFFLAAYEVLAAANPLQSEPADPSKAGRIELAGTIAPICVNSQAIFEMLKNERHCLVDTSCLPLFQDLEAELEPLPQLNNIAVLQSELAINRVSLRRASVTAGSSQGALEESLVTAFPYEQVQPLYLRNASVTLKKST
jgi:tRNA threonylcarbamoyl adenosine modification protein YeaZ